jgi:hypothetical protein
MSVDLALKLDSFVLWVFPLPFVLEVFLFEPFLLIGESDLDLDTDLERETVRDEFDLESVE